MTWSPRSQSSRYVYGALLLSLLNIAFILPLTAQDHETSGYFRPDRWFRFRHKPTLSLEYGFSTVKQNGLGQTIASPRFAELKIGGIVLDTIPQTAIVLDHDYNYAFVSAVTHDLGSTPATGELKTSLWRFGLGWEDGYGYDLSAPQSEIYILGYYGMGIMWSRLHVNDPIPSPPDAELLGLYEGTFRFGTKAEGGIRLKLLPMVSIDAGYERAIVFPRHLFWKWLGSAALEAGGHWLVDRFVNRVRRSSPTVTPVVSFVLKNALSYGIYQLRKEKMNYPFNSEAPLTYDTFKVGVSFMF